MDPGPRGREHRPAHERHAQCGECPSRQDRRAGPHWAAHPFFVSVRGDDAEEISALWGKLAQGSTIVRPLEPAQWAPLYAMLTNRFGITWVLDVTAPYNESTSRPSNDRAC